MKWMRPGVGTVAYVLLRRAKVDNLKAFSWVLFMSVTVVYLEAGWPRASCCFSWR
jgi:hypothetical protein